MPNAVKVFFAYSHKDEALRDELATHLTMMKRQGVIETWHDSEITAGSEWANAIDENLEVADIILLLVSDNFLASDYCYDKEMTRAMEQHETREACVIPIILKPTDWNGKPFGKLQALPKNAKPVTTWQDQNEAFLNIAQGICRVVEDIAKSKSSS
ncbi:toll/interleukin-1 receptor domain-containing protein [Aliinostoc sp. HNIBRCY26]|uniref:toll/interleukin-1 receptor domain-containing protein n=1 Tax=Aliinostoc sp. HNIBRCY26 TaxID=3418997 RepID=UPI003D06B4B8